MADFGISLPLVAGQQHSEVRGTPLYMAPELLQGRYGAAADVWAAGVTLYEVLSGRMPFAPGPEVQTGEQVRQQPRRAALRLLHCSRQD